MPPTDVSFEDAAQTAELDDANPMDWIGQPLPRARGNVPAAALAVPPTQDEDDGGDNLPPIPMPASEPKRVEIAHGWLADDEWQRWRDEHGGSDMDAAAPAAVNERAAKGVPALLARWAARDAVDRERNRNNWDERAAAARERELESPLDDDGQRTRPRGRKSATPRRPVAGAARTRKATPGGKARRARVKPMGDPRTRITGGWLKVPTAISRDRGLSTKAKAVAVAICEATNFHPWNRDLHCDLTHAELGRRAGLGSISSVQRAVGELKSAGHLIVTEDRNRGGLRYRIFLTDD
jgi:hypothetical protein